LAVVLALTKLSVAVNKYKKLKIEENNIVDDGSSFLSKFISP
jgi:hypothetical protein